MDDHCVDATEPRSRGVSALHRVGAALAGVRRSVQPSSIGLLAVLVALPGFALWEATATYRTGVAVKRATELSNAFEQARYAVGAEESLERKYRLEPSAEVRTRHLAAAAKMVLALQQARTMAEPAERRAVAKVLVEHAQYLQAIVRLFGAVDARDLVAATAIDSGEVDPSFGAMEAEVVAFSERHRVDAAMQLRQLSRIQLRVVVATPVVFAFGVALVLLFWRMMRGYQRREKQGLALSERRLRGLVQNTSDMILICDASSTVTYQTTGAETVWGYPADALLGNPLATLTHPEDRAALRDLWQQLLQAHPDSAEGVGRTTELRLRDGADVWREAELIGTNLLHDPAVHGVIVTIRDVSQRKAFEQQLTQQAFYDALTGLPNRVLFRDRLGQALVRAGRRRAALGVLFLDLDNFKLVNDSLGHQIGDALLTEAAARLRGCVRAQDTVARLGGDEFVVILEQLTGEEDALLVAHAIAHQFGRPFVFDGREMVVTASIGIAISDAGKDNAESLLRNADIAMYQAKSDGRSRCVVFNPSMHVDALARLELENDLRRALDQKELRVYYQPIVSMESGEFTEVEALVRWQHPTRGLVLPGEFIPIAEETGLIVPLGLWVLEEACRQVVLWHERLVTEMPLTLSVNLSPRQFQQPSLVADVANALRESGLPANCLKLELTEGVVMRDVEATVRTLWQLKKLGLQLAVDDFGTGYSSLSYLKRLPLDVLKIDRSFVSGVGNNQEDTAIVHTILALAKSLNLKVTGEGIETTEQAALLGEWGCDRGQGYLFSRPLDSHHAGALLEKSARPRVQKSIDALTAAYAF